MHPTGRQSNVDVPPPASGSRGNPLKLMTRNVSWDPNITVVPVEPREPRPRQRTHNTPSSTIIGHRDREPPRSTIHPVLSVESTNITFDARLSPPPTFPPNYTNTMSEPATATGARHLRLVSRDFPWTIDVENSKQNVVTCADVFSALYAGLSLPITPSEWTLADDHKRESMQRANRNRRGGASVKRLRRIDWLGSRVYFKGLSRDDGLSRSRLLPEDDLWPDTWVVIFGSRS